VLPSRAMKALRVEGGRPHLEEVDVPRPAADEALLRVRRAGICSTDLHIVKGYMGFAGTLGHELVGEVIECADRSWIGKRVSGEINLGCARCDRCAAGLSRHCASRSVLGILGKDGCFAEYLTLPIRNLHPIPDAMSDDLAVFVEPLAAAYEIFEQIRVAPDARVLVLGDGKLGLLAAMVMLAHGTDVTVIGRHEKKLAHAGALGARTALASEKIEGGFHVAVEATGSKEGFALACSLLAPRGTLVLKSTFHGPTEIDAAKIVIDELTVMGSRCGPFAPSIRALSSARIDPSALIEAYYPLADGVRAIERAGEPGVLKVVLVPHG
jgi:threonine dehydrogenase-like Zn-dependent dehydrogenase